MVDATQNILTDRKLRVALVGCGRISRNHLSAIAEHRHQLDLIAICDNDPSVLSHVAVGHDVKRFLSFEHLLESESIDLAVLCTPSGLHAEQAMLAASKDVSVMTEKPMATKYEHGLSMIRSFDQSAGQLFVVKQNRFNPTVKLVKQVIDDGRLGRIKLFQSNVYWHRPQTYYDQGSGWRGTWEMDGGALMNQCSHYVDLLQWLCGPMMDVNCMHSTTRQIEVEDTAVVNLRARSGGLGTIAVTMLTYPRNLEGSITILGETGSIKLSGSALNKIEIWELSESGANDINVDEYNYQIDSVYGNGHSLYYEEVISAMRGTSTCSVSGREGIKSLELLTAMYLSARDRRVVGLPLSL